MDDLGNLISVNSLGYPTEGNAWILVDTKIYIQNNNNKATIFFKKNPENWVGCLFMGKSSDKLAVAIGTLWLKGIIFRRGVLNDKTMSTLNSFILMSIYVSRVRDSAGHLIAILSEERK